MKYMLLIPVTISIFMSCNTKKESKVKIDMSYDFQKGFDIDSLKLYISKDSFTTVINQIEKQIVDLTSFNDVFLSRDFIKIYEDATNYRNNVILYLSDTINNKQRRYIALLSMQKKDMSNSLNFLYAYSYLYKQNLANEEMLFQILFPIDLSNRDIIKHYESEQVQKALIFLKENSKTSIDFRNLLNKILSGKTYKEQKKFLKEQYNLDI